MRLDEEEARRRFGSGRVMRLATVGPSGPHLVVATFVLLGDVVVTAVDHKPKTTTRLARLRHVVADPRVSLLVDHYDDEDWTRLWWVRADGSATVLTGSSDRAEPIRMLREKYTRYADQPPDGPVIRVEVTRWRGWAAA